MAEEHIIEQGDCFSSIAKEYGFLEKTLWNHPANAALKEKRKNPNVLLPNDVVVIPDRASGEESASTEQKHIFKAKGEKIKLQLRLLLNGVPRIGIAYVIMADGVLAEGETDSDGWIRMPIPATVRAAKLKLPEFNENYELGLGHLDPLEEISGVQGRLANLGYYGDAINGESDETTQDSLCAFQKHQGIAETGTPDAPTQAALKQKYGC